MNNRNSLLGRSRPADRLSKTNREALGQGNGGTGAQTTSSGQNAGAYPSSQQRRKGRKSP